MDLMDVMRMLAALLATLALVGLAAIAARRLGMTQTPFQVKNRRIRITERLMLDPRRQLMLVQVDEEEHLLLLSPFGDSALARGAAKPAPPEAEPNP